MKTSWLLLGLEPAGASGCLLGLLHCVTKSAYDGAVYELFVAADTHLEAIAVREGYKDSKQKYMVRLLGSRGAGT